MTNHPARTTSLLLLALAGCGDDAALAPDAGMPDAPAMADAPPVCIAPRTPDPDPKVEAIAKVLETKWAAAGIPGGALAVVTNGGATTRTVLIGARAPGSCDAVTRDTLYRVSTPTEAITAMAVVAAADRGLLSLNDPITAHVTMNLTGGDPAQIKVRHLLTHSDGLPTTVPSSCTWNDLASWYADWSTQSAWAPPGTIAQWGMNDIQLAGRILEVATGKSYAQAVKQYLLDPLGSTATFDTPTFEAAPHATPVGFGGIPVQPSTLDCGATMPSAHLYASIDDLTRIVKLMAWGNTAVMTNASFQQLINGNNEPTTVNGDKAGYGMTTFDAGGYQIRYAAGWGAGVTGFFYIPSIDTAFAVTMSKEVGNYEANGIFDIIRGLAGTYAPPDTTLPKTQWTQYASAAATPYTDSVTSPARTLAVAFDGTDLTGTMQIGTDPAIPVTFKPAAWADMFTASYANKSTLVRFWRDTNNQVNRVTGFDFRFGPPLAR